MTVEYQITEKDYVLCGLLSMKMTKKSFIWHMFIDISLIVFGIASLFFYYEVIGYMLIGAGLGASIIPWLLSKSLTPYLWKRHYSKYPLLKKCRTISLKETGIFQTTEESSGLLKWEDIVNWRENGEYILIFLAPRLYIIVPKRISNAELLVDEIRRCLKNKIGNSI